jgi:cysteinyl-tRNA synthetase
VRYYLAAPHYRSVVEFSEEALAEADTTYRRIEGFVRRARDVVGAAGDVDVSRAELPSAYVAAMDDDLSTPAAIAVLQDAVREGNRQLDAGDVEGLAETIVYVRAMLDVLGPDPLSAPWATRAAGGDLRPVVEALASVALEQRAAARDRRDFAAADAIRDQLKSAGVLVEDTPSGARFTLRTDG